MKSDHVVIKMTPPHYTLECKHCGDTHVLHTPCALDMAISQMNTFTKLHKGCKKAIGK